MVGVIGSFQLAFLYPALCWLVLGYLVCLFELRRLATARLTFYVGMLVGLGVYVPPMQFLWTVFGGVAVPLWLILALFHGVFLLVLNRVEARWGATCAAVMAPVLWCAIEYFRSEVWWLRFSWFTAGSMFQSGPQPFLATFGVYGDGLVCAAVAVTLTGLRRPSLKSVSGLGLTLSTVFALVWLCRTPLEENLVRSLRVAGVQLEFPGVPEVRFALDRLEKNNPDAGLVLLSEHTFDGPVPEIVRAWCRKNRKWLVAGGKESLFDAGELASPAQPTGSRSDSQRLPFWDDRSGDPFFNTAFVINPQGETVFTQAKSRPIQFFQDGEPARQQRLWESPWGRLGIAICYNASCRRVMDVLVRAGTEALLIPTMDLEPWGSWQHQVNARMSRLRALVYGVPLFRVASSGVSQLIDRRGLVTASAPFPGSGEMIAGELLLRPGGGTVPLDSWLAPTCTWMTLGIILWLLAGPWFKPLARTGNLFLPLLF